MENSQRAREITAEVKRIAFESNRSIVEHIDLYTGSPLANFLCTPLTSEVSISDELDEARWFNLKEIEETQNMDLDLKRSLISGLKGNWTERHGRKEKP